MRIIGYDILACPYCAQLYKDQIIVSFNNFGAQYYSDGYVEGGSIPKAPNIVKCVNNDCGKFFLLIEATKKGKIEYSDGFSPEWKDSCLLADYRIEIEELEEALSIGFCDNAKKETIVRIHLFQRYNDPIRKDKNHKYSSFQSNKVINNINRLIEFCNNSEVKPDLHLLAELYREKSDFTSCIDALNQIKDKKDSPNVVKEKLYSQAMVKDNVVFNIANIAVKKEFRCNNCSDSLILFDLDKLNKATNNYFEFGYYLCKFDNTVFNSKRKKANPSKFYELNMFQRTFKTKKPYSQLVDNIIACPICQGREIDIFKPESQNCIKCGVGQYEHVKWFD